MKISAKKAAAILGPMVIIVALGAGLAEAESDWLDKGKDLLRDLGGEESPALGLSESDIAAGLKEALRVGTENVVSQVGTLNGFNTDPEIHIPLPGSLDTVKSGLEAVGMGESLEKLELQLNRAAEAAAPKGKELFWQAISSMALEDAREIYNGPDDAATQYFRSKMSEPLAQAMRPVVSDSLAQVGAVQTYDQVMQRYDDLPFAPDVKADLTNYGVEKAMDGIFFYLAREEAAIRENPAKRTTELLKRVFGAGS
jgi:hypothetical protein